MDGQEIIPFTDLNSMLYFPLPRPSSSQSGKGGRYSSVYLHSFAQAAHQRDREYSRRVDCAGAGAVGATAMWH